MTTRKTANHDYLGTGTALLAALLCATTATAQMQSLAIPALDRTPAQADQATRLPAALEGVGFTQKLGEQVPLDLELVDHEGKRVRIGDLIGDRPVLLAPVYFECPMLCSLVLDGVIRGLKPIELEPARELEVLVVSFDPEETPELAAEARKSALSRYGRPQSEPGWHFLTGEADDIAALMAAIGFDYRYDEASGDYAHAGGIVLLTPEGEISRYFFGVDFPPRELRIALVDASGGSIGTVIDQVFLFCFHYDATLGKYSAVIVNILKLGGIVTMLCLGVFLFMMWRFERSRSATTPEPHPCSR